jgi:hypothetical protein
MRTPLSAMAWQLQDVRHVVARALPGHRVRLLVAVSAGVRRRERAAEVLTILGPLLLWKSRWMAAHPRDDQSKQAGC